MAVNYGTGLGPILEPNYDLQSWSFIDDFIGYWDSTSADASTWRDLATTGGTSVAVADEPHGAIDITNGAVLGADGGIELNGEPFQFKHDKDLLFACKIKLSAITGTNLFVGLHVENFDVGVSTGSGSLTGNHIGFHTQGDASIDFSSADGTTQSISDTTDDFVANTYRILAMKYSAIDGKFRYYVDGQLRGSHNIRDDKLPADATNLTMGIHSEFATAAVTATVDYIYIIGER